MNQLNIISLNTAGSRFGGIPEFLQGMSPYREPVSGGFLPSHNVDIYCFQEVISQFYNPSVPSELHRLVPYHYASGEINNEHELRVALPRYSHHFVPHMECGSAAPAGNMMSVKNLGDWNIAWKRFAFGAEHIFSLQPKGKNVVLQWAAFSTGSHFKNDYDSDQVAVLVAQVHGIWEESQKGDTPLKFYQSKKIVETMEYLKIMFPSARQILCGDFNLVSETQSIRMIEEAGFTNLNREYFISNTRSAHYHKPIREADYMFISEGIEPVVYKTLAESVSDHLPLQLICNVS